MPRYFIQLSYNGAAYNGWQVQQNTPHTVQQVLQDKLGMILGEPLDITGCGRTDTGVHAKDFFAHVDLVQTLSHENFPQLVYKFNQVLPADIAIKAIYAVKEDASSRFAAMNRTYHYLLHNYKDPFIQDASYFYYGTLDFDLMNRAATHLMEVRDFTSFSKVNTQTHTNNCKVLMAQWVQFDEGRWVFIITADRFLRNMVRAIVGTLLEVGRGKLNIDEFKHIIENKNRSDAGMSAPAHALYLARISYPEDIFL
ncbi:MAG: tRNA pseudouridine(38-40) synthase TruA [Bacteroidetes bacterium]|nr:tRNA pseudouridine(38-40) synthase TruA [Bacteroidota bacterium]